MPHASFPHDQLTLLIDREAFAESSYWLPSDAQLMLWVLAAITHSLAYDQQETQVELSLSCVTATDIRQLNADYRSKDSETNVLSFPADMPILPSDDAGTAPMAVLGDVVVCPEVLVAEAAQQNKALEHHWAHMVIHSVLHLNGFDHQDEITARAMETLEIQILSSLGISNPYLAVSAK